MIGTVLGNRYEIIEKIGEGGMAYVYKAKCRLLNRNVAVKVLREEFVDDEDFVKKFKRESQAAASLSHPNIVNVYDVGVEEIEGTSIHYIVMEYIKGKTLKEIIKEKGKLSVEETLDYSIQIAEALEHAHKNHIVHRDIKPHNIMITDDERVKVTDFGIARAATTSTVTNSTNVIGSVHYFSPEQARGGYTDEKSDIYSLGIVMYEMLTGKVPYEGDSPISVALKHIEGEIDPPRKIDNTVPIGLEKIIMKCVQKNQFDRYQSAGELLYDLKRLKYSYVDDFIENTAIIDSPTQIMPNIQIENEDEEHLNSRKANKKKDKGENSLKPVLLAILLAFVVTGFIAFGFLKLKDLFVVAEAVVPDLVGMHVDVAEEELEKQGLKLKVEKEVYNSEFDEGEIVSQNVKAGEKVKKGFTIGVTVSKGSKLVKVPNLINRNITEAAAILREYNLDEGEVKYDYSDTVEANIIMNQFPEPYTEVEANTKIDLIVSKGPKSKPVLMPKLIGLKEKDAENALKSFKLKRGQRIEKPSDEYPEGYVIWQSIEPGVAVEPNTSVDIYISTGPEKVPEEGPKEDINNEVPFNLNLTLPEDGAEVTIRIDRVQDGVSETVYEKVHIADGSTIKIPLKGKLDAQFEIYFNGVHNETFSHPDR